MEDRDFIREHLHWLKMSRDAKVSQIGILEGQLEILRNQIDILEKQVSEQEQKKEGE